MGFADSAGTDNVRSEDADRGPYHFGTEDL